jgi:putative SOS response-associated peptidase YedK
VSFPAQFPGRIVGVFGGHTERIVVADVLASSLQSPEKIDVREQRVIKFGGLFACNIHPYIIAGDVASFQDGVMCGRFTLRVSPQAVARAFNVADVPEFSPRYNIAPTQQVLAIRAHNGERQASFLHWGLIPSWADDPKIGNRTINARADGVAVKSSFRSAFKRSRCLVVADGFYEWKKTGAAKQPYFIRLKKDRPFAFAGLAEHWHRSDKAIDSCTIITTDPNEMMAEIHDRMPVILSPDDYDLWLDPEFEGKEQLQSLLRPYPADETTAYAVSTLVNNPKNENPACVEAKE